MTKTTGLMVLLMSWGGACASSNVDPEPFQMDAEVRIDAAVPDADVPDADVPDRMVAVPREAGRPDTNPPETGPDTNEPICLECDGCCTEDRDCLPFTPAGSECGFIGGMTCTPCAEGLFCASGMCVQPGDEFYRVTVVSAEVPEFRPTGQNWDRTAIGAARLPDVFAQIDGLRPVGSYASPPEIVQTTSPNNDTTPLWDETLGWALGSVLEGPGGPGVSFKLWDRDPVLGDADEEIASCTFRVRSSAGERLPGPSTTIRYNRTCASATGSGTANRSSYVVEVENTRTR
ncbi:MAG: hypothetical protein AAGF12_06040 [Myxococcota bacterium]